MKHKLTSGVMFVCICLSMVFFCWGHSYADEARDVAPESTSSAEISVAPGDIGTSQGIMEEDIIIIEEVVEEDRKLAPNPTYNEKIPTYDIENVPETSDNGMNKELLLTSGLVVVALFSIVCFNNKKSVNL